MASINLIFDREHGHWGLQRNQIDVFDRDIAYLTDWHKIPRSRMLWIQLSTKSLPDFKPYWAVCCEFGCCLDIFPDPETSVWARFQNLLHISNRLGFREVPFGKRRPADPNFWIKILRLR